MPGGKVGVCGGTELCSDEEACVCLHDAIVHVCVCVHCVRAWVCVRALCACVCMHVRRVM